MTKLINVDELYRELDRVYLRAIRAGKVPGVASTEARRHVCSHLAMLVDWWDSQRRVFARTGLEKLPVRIELSWEYRGSYRIAHDGPHDETPHFQAGVDGETVKVHAGFIHTHEFSSPALDGYPCPDAARSDPRLAGLLIFSD